MGITQKKGLEVDEYGIPLIETSRVTYKDHQKNIRYIITRHPFSLEFYLYEIVNNKAKKIDTNPDFPQFKKLDKSMEQWLNELEKYDEKGI